MSKQRAEFIGSVTEGGADFLRTIKEKTKEKGMMIIISVFHIPDPLQLSMILNIIRK